MFREMYFKEHWTIFMVISNSCLEEYPYSKFRKADGPEIIISAR